MTTPRLTWFRSAVDAGHLLAQLGTAAASALVLRPSARLLQLVDDAHDVDPTTDKETDA